MSPSSEAAIVQGTSRLETSLASSSSEGKNQPIIFYFLPPFLQVLVLNFIRILFSIYSKVHYYLYWGAGTRIERGNHFQNDILIIGDDTAWGMGDTILMKRTPGIANFLAKKLEFSRAVKQSWTIWNCGVIGSTSRQWIPEGDEVSNPDDSSITSKTSTLNSEKTSASTAAVKRKGGKKGKSPTKEEKDQDTPEGADDSTLAVSGKPVTAPPLNYLKLVLENPKWARSQIVLILLGWNDSRPSKEGVKSSITPQETLRNLKSLSLHLKSLNKQVYITPIPNFNSHLSGDEDSHEGNLERNREILEWINSVNAEEEEQEEEVKPWLYYGPDCQWLNYEYKGAFLLSEDKQHFGARGYEKLGKDFASLLENHMVRLEFQKFKARLGFEG